MNRRTLELLLGPMRAVRRAGLLWAGSVAALVVMTVAFWPAFKGSTSMYDLINQMPQGVVQAFGLQDLGTPAGYLRGNLYAFLLPLLFAGAGIGFANSLTASEEDAGRFEILLAQPVSHRAVFLGRAAAVYAWVGLLTLVTAVVQLACDPVVGLSIGLDRLASTLVLCGLGLMLYNYLRFDNPFCHGKPEADPVRAFRKVRFEDPVEMARIDAGPFVLHGNGCSRTFCFRRNRDRASRRGDIHGIEQQVQFVGRQSRSEVAEAMRRCSVFVLPSRNEGLGCVYLEAMSCGKPVIAFGKGGV
ncbi:MAG: glycosyltransferase, partial [Candidatus Limnocylindrales bacterium]